MQKSIINPKGNWEFWSEDMKQLLSEAEINLAVGDKIVFENEDFRVWSIHLPVGSSLPFHKHCHRYFWTVLSCGKSISFYDDGSVIETNYNIGDTTYYENLNAENTFIHNLQNMGDTELIFTTVEFLR